MALLRRGGNVLTVPGSFQRYTERAVLIKRGIVHAQKSFFFAIPAVAAKAPKKKFPHLINPSDRAAPVSPLSAPLDPTARYAELRRKYSRKEEGEEVAAELFFGERKRTWGLDAGSSDYTVLQIFVSLQSLQQRRQSSVL